MWEGYLNLFINEIDDQVLKNIAICCFLDLTSAQSTNTIKQCTGFKWKDSCWKNDF